MSVSPPSANGREVNLMSENEAEQSCPACGDGGYRDYMMDSFTTQAVPVRVAVCENRDCRVREFYIVVSGVNVETEAHPEGGS